MNIDILNNFYKGKKVLVTGHTGFKGSWLSIWLHELGAEVVGVGLEPYSEKDNFVLSSIGKKIKADIRADIRDGEKMKEIFKQYQPEIVFHLAAQPLVRLSYEIPVETYQTNVMGTINIMEAIRVTDSVKVGVMITTDKCYDNKEQMRGYKEDDPFGGYDPYSSSKGACEIASGSMNLTFMSILQKEFSISSGSSILFPGNISDATFSLEAVYQQRVNMSSLTGTDASIENSSKVIPVQNVILLSGTLQNPEVNFDIRLPNVDPSVEEEVFSYVDRSNERDMLNQTLSLLLLSQFYNNTTSGSSSPLDNGLSSGYAVLANSVGNVVSNMVQFVNVNFDYSAAREMSNEKFDVGISREWEKFYFESTLGFGSDARELNGNENGFTGDILVGYKLSPQMHLFVFNRSNTNDYTRADLPYKQGVGLKFTRDFDKWKDFFKKNGKK